MRQQLSPSTNPQASPPSALESCSRLPLPAVGPTWQGPRATNRPRRERGVGDSPGRNGGPRASGWDGSGEDLYLEPEAAFAAAQRQGRDSGDALTVSGWTLRRRLHERGLLASMDDTRGVLTVRRVLDGSRRNVLHTSSNLLSTPSTRHHQPDQQEPLFHAENQANGRVGQVLDKGREENGSQDTHTRWVKGRI